MERIYNKLVRDKIPEIIEANGEEPIVRTLNSSEYRQELNKKLKEEVNEYLEDESVEELADVLEVIHGILNSKQMTFDELEKVRKAKSDKRGGFEKRIYLEMVLPKK